MMASPREHLRLVARHALRERGWPLIFNILFSIFPALSIGILFYMGLVERDFAVDEIQSWLVLAIALGAWLVCVIIGQLIRSIHSVWEGDQATIERNKSSLDQMEATKEQRIAQLETEVADLVEQMRPKLSVEAVPPPYRVTPDLKWYYGSLRVANDGTVPIKNCYAKLLSFLVIQSAAWIPSSPAAGARFLWPDVAYGISVDIGGTSQELMNLASWTVDDPDHWYLQTSPTPPPTPFPLPVGIYGIEVEVGADNVPSTKFVGRITYSANRLLIEATP